MRQSCRIPTLDWDRTSQSRYVDVRRALLEALWFSLHCIMYKVGLTLSGRLKLSPMSLSGRWTPY